jgi:hypothetical protein
MPADRSSGGKASLDLAIFRFGQPPVVKPAGPAVGAIAVKTRNECSHPLDGQLIEFDPPIDGGDSPSQWLTLWQGTQQEGAILERSVTA